MTKEELAKQIVESDAFMWLMAGANHPESHLNALRPAYREYKELTEIIHE